MNVKTKIESRYSGQAGKSYQDTVNEAPPGTYRWIANLRREKISPHVNTTDTVLEYGVGTGWNLARLDCGKKIGVDLSGHLAPFLKEKGIDFITDISSVPDGTADAVICHHVLEHTGHPLGILENIHRVLTSNGRLVLFVPYETQRKYRHYNPKEPNHHLYSWNVQTLGALVEASGFRVLEGGIRPFGYDRFAGIWALRFNIGEKGFRFLRQMLLFIRPVSEVYLIARRETDSAAP